MCLHSSSCSATECVSGDWSCEDEQENLADVKQDPDDVCSLILCTLCLEKKFRLTVASNFAKY